LTLVAVATPRVGVVNDGDARGARDDRRVPLSAIWPPVPLAVITSPLTDVVGPVVIPAPAPASALLLVIAPALPAIAAPPALIPEIADVVVEFAAALTDKVFASTAVGAMAEPLGCQTGINVWPLVVGLAINVVVDAAL